MAENSFAQAAEIFSKIGARLEAKRAEWAVDQCSEVNSASG
jgi:hypothetical protein